MVSGFTVIDGYYIPERMIERKFPGGVLLRDGRVFTNSTESVNAYGKV